MNCDCTECVNSRNFVKAYFQIPCIVKNETGKLIPSNDEERFQFAMTYIVQNYSIRNVKDLHDFVPRGFYAIKKETIFDQKRNFHGIVWKSGESITAYLNWLFLEKDGKMYVDHLNGWKEYRTFYGIGTPVLVTDVLFPSDVYDFCYLGL